MAVAAVVVPVLLRQCRRFWNRGRFWVIVSLLAIAQVPLVIAVRPWIDQHGRSSTLLFGVVDCLFVIFTIVFLCSSSDEEGT
jgi:integral membrane sensor domain MASE1